MKVTSPAFEAHQSIPKKYTCEGDDISPPLDFTNVPVGTKSFAVIIDDPDAPGGVFDHWIAWNISSETKKLPENAQVPNQGRNHFNVSRYRGPCPPSGASHRYYFKVYALDQEILALANGSLKQELEKAMQGHILAQGELMGTYRRK